MSGYRSRELSREVLSEQIGDGGRPEQTILKVTVAYSLGGYSFATYKPEPRGYWVSVAIETIGTSGNGFSFTRFGLFDGTAVKSFIEAAPRFSAKRLAAVQPDPALVQRMKASVLSKWKGAAA